MRQKRGAQLFSTAMASSPPAKVLDECGYLYFPGFIPSKQTSQKETGLQQYSRWSLPPTGSLRGFFPLFPLSSPLLSSPLLFSPRQAEWLTPAEAWIEGLWKGYIQMSWKQQAVSHAKHSHTSPKHVHSSEHANTCTQREKEKISQQNGHRIKSLLLSRPSSKQTHQFVYMETLEPCGKHGKCY